MILNRQRAVRVARQPLELFLARVRKELGLGEADVTICLVSDAEIARMNEAYRKKKGPTDVLSFPEVALRGSADLRRAWKPSLRETRRSQFLGDIAISPATAQRNAKQLGRTLGGELQILILHGVLHLLGYDHETDGGEMNSVERRLRRRLGLT
jgi:probable rRNA maturation factor